MLVKSLKILITNNTLGQHAGSEVYARDLALGLLAHGHRPVLFSTVLGAVAEELRQATIPVVDDLAKIAEIPDLIHGQHHLETMMAVLHFPGVPAIYMCHGWLPWEEGAPIFPGIRRYVAVDDLCFERLNSVCGIPGSRIEVIRNAVNMGTFAPRAELPVRPKRALVFSNHPAQSPAVDIIRRTCLAFGIERVDTMGAVANTSVARPQDVLGAYDVVFAKGRSALEALAVGCAVIVCDIGRLGEMVTSQNVERLRRLNFGVRTIQQPLTEEGLQQQLLSYQAHDMPVVRQYIRQNADFDAYFQQILALYADVLLDETRIDPHVQSRAASAYLRDLKMILIHANKYPEKMLEHVAVIDMDRGRLNTQLINLNAEKNLANETISELSIQKNTANELISKLNIENDWLKMADVQNGIKIHTLQLQWDKLLKSRSWRLAQHISRVWNLFRGVWR
jgi:glycosyltransferase involved in cell wall biosynthesis